MGFRSRIREASSSGEWVGPSEGIGATRWATTKKRLLEEQMNGAILWTSIAGIIVSVLTAYFTWKDAK